MNILLLTYQGDIAGSTLSITYLAKGLAARGHSVYVGCRKESLLAGYFNDTDVQVIPMEFRSKLDWKNARQIAHACKTHNIEIINAQSSYDRYTSMLARMFMGVKAKLVFTRRQVSKSLGGVQSWLYERATDRIVAVSEGIRESIRNDGISDGHITVIRNGTPADKYAGIDPEITGRLRETFKLSDTDFVIGCVSRLKEQDQILDALQYLKEPVTVVFVGVDHVPGASVESLHAMGHRIVFAGRVSASEVLPYYGLFDIFILASVMEGLSQSLLEAMYLKVPVIATAAAGNLDLVQSGENGLLFENKDTRALAENIEKLRYNPVIAQHLVDAGYKTASEDYSIENTIDGYEALFNELLKQRGAKDPRTVS